MSGDVLVNGKARSQHSERWRRTSCYIQQYSLLRTRLTVGEAMTIAAHLKLGCTISSAFKHTQVGFFLYHSLKKVFFPPFFQPHMG